MRGQLLIRTCSYSTMDTSFTTDDLLFTHYLTHTHSLSHIYIYIPSLCFFFFYSLSPSKFQFRLSAFRQRGLPRNAWCPAWCRRGSFRRRGWHREGPEQTDIERRKQYKKREEKKKAISRVYFIYLCKDSPMIRPRARGLMSVIGRRRLGMKSIFCLTKSGRKCAGTNAMFWDRVGKIKEVVDSLQRKIYISIYICICVYVYIVYRLNKKDILGSRGCEKRCFLVLHYFILM